VELHINVPRYGPCVFMPVHRCDQTSCELACGTTVTTARRDDFSLYEIESFLNGAIMSSNQAIIAPG
jgi:hypothetical protein